MSLIFYTSECSLLLQPFVSEGSLTKSVCLQSLDYGQQNIKRENFSFSTKLIVGDFLRPSGQVHENGEEAYHRYTEHEMGEEIDKVRRENGWKPRKRNKPSNSTSSRKSNGTLPISLENMGGTVQEQYQFLQRLQAEAVERDKRKREEQEQVKLQKEAMR